MALAQPALIGVNTSFHDDPSGLVIKHTQDIDDSFIESNKRERAFNAQHRAQDLHRVASIPTAVVELWKRQGFDIYEQSTTEIMKRLRSENLVAFITSDKV